MVGIVILNYNNSGRTIECLESLHTHCLKGNYKVCVVDNASSAEEFGRLEGACSEHIIRADVNGGYARGNNLGCSYFDSDEDVDKILILNDDTIFSEDIISPLEEFLDSHCDCGVVFPLVCAPDGSIDKACLRKQKTLSDLILQATSLGKLGMKRKEFLPVGLITGKDPVYTEVPPGSCMMFRKEVFRSIGWFDPNTFLYFEEHIISAKLKRKGLRCVLLPGIRIAHIGAATTGKQTSKEIFRHWRHSYLYFIKEYTDTPAIIRHLLAIRTYIGSWGK